MVDYKVNGRSMTLSVETSRACGHLAGMDGEETPDGASADALRREIRQDAQIIADVMGKSIEVYASHPSCQDWTVDVIEPQQRAVAQLYTDYPFTELGDAPGQAAPIREVRVLSYDGNKYCRVLVDGHKLEVKAGYIYRSRPRPGVAPERAVFDRQLRSQRGTL
jgi:hypothetical protein